MEHKKNSFQHRKPQVGKISPKGSVVQIPKCFFLNVVLFLATEEACEESRPSLKSKLSGPRNPGPAPFLIELIQLGTRARLLDTKPDFWHTIDTRMYTVNPWLHLPPPYRGNADILESFFNVK